MLNWKRSTCFTKTAVW